MNNEEIKIWLKEKIDNCYAIVDLENHFYENTYLIYDSQYIREKKLGRILHTEISEPIVGNLNISAFTMCCILV